MFIESQHSFIKNIYYLTSLYSYCIWLGLIFIEGEEQVKKAHLVCTETALFSLVIVI